MARFIVALNEENLIKMKFGKILSGEILYQASYSF